MKKVPFFRLIRQSGIYALGNVAIKFSGLLLAPFLLDTTYLPLKAYGQLGVLLIFAQLCIQLTGLGLGSGLLRYVGKKKLDEPGSAGAFTALVSVLFCSIIAFCLLISFSGQLANLLLDNYDQKELIALLATYICAKVIAAIPMMMLRINEQAGLYTLAVILEMVALIGSMYFFLVIQGEGLYGILKSYAIASTLSALVVVVSTLYHVNWRFDSKLIRPLLTYGGPLVLVGMAGIILNAGDRFILKALTSDEEVGMYEWAARMSGVLHLFVVQSFQLAFTVIGLKSLGKGDEGFHRRAFRHYVIWAGWAALGISILSFELTVLLRNVGADEHYMNSITLVFPLALGVMLYGIFAVINNVLYATAKTNLMTQNVIISAIFNVALNFILVPSQGAVGAAIATVLSYAILVILTNRAANAQISIGYSWRTLFIVFLLVISLYFLGQLAISFSIVVRTIVRLLVILAYVPLLFAFRIYKIEEAKVGLAYVSQQFIRHKSR